MTAAAPLTATVILTAGESSRFGSPKQAALVNSRPVLTALLERLAAHAPQSRVVVLGAQADLLGGLVPSGEWSIVVNKGWASGVGSSVRTGLASVPDAEQVVEMLGDLAWLQAEAIERVVGHA